MASSIFEVAANISTPLGLAGLIAAALFLVIRQVLRLDIFRRLTGPATLALLKHLVDRLFALALIAMVLGFIGFLYLKYIQAEEGRASGNYNPPGP